MIYNEGYAPDPGSIGATGYITRAEGCRVWGPGGQEYIDLALGGGSMILGHAHPAVVEAVARQARDGTIYAAPHAAVHRMDELLNRFISWLPGRVWCNSGSEAVMRLCRIARAVTRKRKIGLFSGGWHGSWDGTLVEENYEITGDLPEPVMQRRSAGIPGRPSDSILFLPYRDPAALELIREYAAELACVLVEPVQGSNPGEDNPCGDLRRFLLDLRSTTKDCGVLLAFDEVVTGFRLAPGGGSDYFNVSCDLAAYGKILGGGLPVGMVAGTTAIMDEAHRRKVFFGGTFSANPLTIAAGRATLELLSPQVYETINQLGKRLQIEVNCSADEFDLPMHMMGCGSIRRLILSRTRVTSRRQRDQVEPDAKQQGLYYDLVRSHGISVGTNRIQFLSSVHTEREVCDVAQALCTSAQMELSQLGKGAG